MACDEYPMWIGGREVRSAKPRTVRVPFDGAPVGIVFEAEPVHVEEAVAAAKSAAPLMRSLTRDERSAILRRAHAAVSARREEFARAVSSESGKPIREGRLEAERASQTLLFASEEAHRLTGEVVPMDASPAGKGRWGMTVREPLGVIAAITPFNFPLNLSVHKIAPALAAGNAVVHKPASATPISGLLLARVLSECGLPDGALNVITGAGGEIGAHLAGHPDIAMITFTGSDSVGARLRLLAAEGRKRITLELGNNSALIVEPDGNLEEAVSRAVPGSYAHSGQVCISIQRIYVHRNVSSRFTEAFATAARALSIGHPFDETTEVSSLITEAEATRVAGWVEEAVRSGARMVGPSIHRQRATLGPVVLADVPEHAQVWRQEAFGPVAGINTYQTLDEAIERVNQSAYGLQAGIFTSDIGKAFAAAERVHVGGFLINDVPQFRVDQMPYGGVKLSGSGREGPKYAIEEMTEPKLITWRYPR